MMYTPRIGARYKTLGKDIASLRPGDVTIIVSYEKFAQSWPDRCKGKKEEDYMGQFEGFECFFWELPGFRMKEKEPSTFNVKDHIDHARFFNTVICTKHFENV